MGAGYLGVLHDIWAHNDGGITGFHHRGRNALSEE